MKQSMFETRPNHDINKQQIASIPFFLRLHRFENISRKHGTAIATKFSIHLVNGLAQTTHICKLEESKYPYPLTFNKEEGVLHTIYNDFLMLWDLKKLKKGNTVKYNTKLKLVVITRHKKIIACDESRKLVAYSHTKFFSDLSEVCILRLDYNKNEILETEMLVLPTNRPIQQLTFTKMGDLIVTDVCSSSIYHKGPKGIYSCIYTVNGDIIELSRGFLEIKRGERDREDDCFVNKLSIVNTNYIKGQTQIVTKTKNYNIPEFYTLLYTGTKYSQIFTLDLFLKNISFNMYIVTLETFQGFWGEKKRIQTHSIREEREGILDMDLWKNITPIRMICKNIGLFLVDEKFIFINLERNIKYIPIQTVFETYGIRTSLIEY